ncbi:MAG: hypothetical protein P8X74_03070 [Reinekea sp.]
MREQFGDNGLSDAVREMRDAAALGLLSLSRAFFGLQIQPLRLQLRRKLDAQQYVRYQQHLPCELIDGGEFDEVWFDRKRLLRPLPSANPALAELNDRIVGAIWRF